VDRFLEGKGGRVSGERADTSSEAHRELRLSLPCSLQREGEEGQRSHAGVRGVGRVEWCEECGRLGVGFYSCGRAR
jgi:hypothetical protein